MARQGRLRDQDLAETIKMLTDERLADCGATARQSHERNSPSSTRHAPTVDTPESTNSRKRSEFAQNLKFCASPLPLYMLRPRTVNHPNAIAMIGVTVTRTSFV